MSGSVVAPARSYVDIATLWVRAAWAYPTSFLMMAFGSLLITALSSLGSG